MKSKYALMSVLVIFFLSVISSPIGLAQNDGSEYRVVVSESIETPDRTFTVDGDQYHVSEIAERKPGESLSVDSFTPGDENYGVYLYNSDRKIADTKAATGDDSVTFETDELSPGTYIVAIYADGTIETVHPVVISGYAVSIDAPADATQESTVDLSAQVTAEGSSGTPHEVAVVLASAETHERVSLSRTSDGTYTASVSLEDFATGEYSVYAVATSDEEVYGEPELLGISDAATLTIGTHETTGTATTNSDSTGEQVTTEQSTTGETESDETTVATATESRTVTTDQSTATSSSTTERRSTRSTTGNVITPADTTTESPGQSGFGPVVAVVTLVAAVLLRSRRD